MGDMALPQKMKWAFKELDNIRKENYSWVPSSGQGTYNAGQKIYIDLPLNSLVDLSTFQMAYEGATTHLGSPATAGDDTLQTRFFPRNTASIIQNLEVKVNNVSIFNVPDYNLVWNKLYDYTQSQDGLNRRKIGENADPSNKTYKDAATNMTIPRRGYVHGIAGGDAAYDKDNYVIKSWLGPFASASTQIIDTTLLGTVSIIITLAPSSILMNGAPIYAAAGALAAANNDAGFDIAAQTARNAAGGAGALAEQPINYTVKDISLTIDRYHMPEAFYQAQASLLSSGSVYKLWFPNYAVLTGTPVLAVNKAGTHRFSISTRSLDWVMGTFKLPNFDTPTTPLITRLSTGDAQRYLGTAATTFENQVKNGLPLLFNNSRYLATNGASITSTKWKIGTHEYRTKTPQESFDALCNHFNVQNDMNGGMYPGIQSINHYIDTFYGDIISLNVSGESNDIYSVSGINASQGPINIEWYVNSAAIPVNPNALITGVNDICIPYLIAGYSSHINIRGGRQIELVS
jgi:hypothetical protein